ncbi:hypothetical protein ACS15_2363 [Ralstonia insidiosa]|uniref:Uncharacterized protein n=1 Tax=Ralstonia insidiosa TaxID=190721 RepID=A0AAC9FRX1_9RALS|nr:hypothetical protein ACS15_2363 [Ralstonia insidiosa]
MSSGLLSLQASPITVRAWRSRRLPLEAVRHIVGFLRHPQGAGIGASVDSLHFAPV